MGLRRSSCEAGCPGSYGTNTFKDALDPSGTPLAYFPEIIPQARGDQVIAPTPTKQSKGAETLKLTQTIKGQKNIYLRTVTSF